MRTLEEVDEALRHLAGAITSGIRTGDPSGTVQQMLKMAELLLWIKGEENGFSDLMVVCRNIDKRHARPQ